MTVSHPPAATPAGPRQARGPLSVRPSVGRTVPELLAPAGSLDAVRAAVANGADAVYLGAEGFNARDEGAQLTIEELQTACRLAHAQGVRIYLTLNVLIKPAELAPALTLLARAVDHGIDAVIVQDIGLVRLIRRVFPDLEIHGSTQMTVHDPVGAAFVRDLGVARIVLARENTVEDLDAIRVAVPDLGLEAFVHGALCISYSGQCYMSGLISERSANRGSCAQACRKDYVLADGLTGQTLDSGYLISAKDLAAATALAALARAGVRCLKIEGRKKRPEYVATVTQSYRQWLDRLASGDETPPPAAELEPLVQIYSRGFTSALLHGNGGRDFVTRDRPDNRGVELGLVVHAGRGELTVQVAREVRAGDGLAFEPPARTSVTRLGGTVLAVRETRPLAGGFRQTLALRESVPVGATVWRNADARLLAASHASYAELHPPVGGTVGLDVRLFGVAGAPLKAIFSTGPVGDVRPVTVQTTASLSAARNRPLDEALCRAHFGRLGDSRFTLRNVDMRGVRGSLFIPVSALNHLRQAAVEELEAQFEWARAADAVVRSARIEAAVSEPVAASANGDRPDASFRLAANVFRLEDARAAAASGASDVVVDPFLRHPMPSVTRFRSMVQELAGEGATVWVRTPTIIRPAEWGAVAKWLDLGLPTVTGHLGLARSLAREGRRVTADYAVNCFNQHTASIIFAAGVERIHLSVELTLEEMVSVSAPWSGRGFAALLYGRPEGMTIEHCVLSAAFGREPTTCRDLCVQRHPHVQLTDPAGYTFAVATDSNCRNRLLHSRPIEATQFLPALWGAGIRGYHLVFNVPGDPVGDLVAGYAAAIRTVAAGEPLDSTPLQSLLDGAFTRGHYARAV